MLSADVASSFHQSDVSVVAVVVVVVVVIIVVVVKSVAT